MAAIQIVIHLLSTEQDTYLWVSRLVHICVRFLEFIFLLYIYDVDQQPLLHSRKPPLRWHFLFLTLDHSGEPNRTTDAAKVCALMCRLVWTY